MAEAYAKHTDIAKTKARKELEARLSGVLKVGRSSKYLTVDKKKGK